MDLDAILQARPELVIVDELAHTNVEGSRHRKRWEDVMELLDANINVISAINIQHIESLSGEVKEITGIEMKERVPDRILQEADEVVNIDLTSEELIGRLKAGKIYRPEKIQIALDNFFRTENILQLRELALKEVAFRVEKKWKRKYSRQFLPPEGKRFWPASAAMNRRPGASSEKHTGFPRVTVRRLSPFTSRRQGSPPTASIWHPSAICLIISSWWPNWEGR